MTEENKEKGGGAAPLVDAPVEAAADPAPAEPPAEAAPEAHPAAEEAAPAPTEEVEEEEAHDAPAAEGAGAAAAAAAAAGPEVKEEAPAGTPGIKAEEEGPSDEALVAKLRELLGTADMQVTSEKALRRSLEEHFGSDLTGRKAVLREEITRFLEEQAEAGDEEEAAEEEEDKPKVTPKRRRSGHGLGSLLSAEMQEFLGEESMPRTQVVKRIWEYIKANNLQDPKNKRIIRPDEKLGKILKPPVNMLSMNKQISKHVFTRDSIQYIEEEDEDSDEDDEEERPAKKAKKSPAAKTPSKGGKGKTPQATPAKGGASTGKKKAKGGKGGGFGAAVPISKELQKFLGHEGPIARTEVVSKIWDYIKAHELQNPKDKREIMPDGKLGKILKAPVNMFSMNKQLAAHFIKPGDGGEGPE